MMKGVLVAFLILAPIASYGQEIVRYSYFDTGKKFIKEQFILKDTVSFIYEGAYTSYFRNGKIESCGQFNNNKTTGVWKFYYETGGLRMEGALEDNKSQGAWRFYLSSGQLAMQGLLQNDKKEGLWKILFEDGSIRETGNFVGGKKVGTWKAYYDSKHLRSTTDYEDGLEYVVNYNHLGNIQSKGNNKAGIKTGVWHFYDEDGLLKSKGDYGDGMKVGEWVNYYPSGKVCSKGMYSLGGPNGQWVHFDEAGRITDQKYYDEGGAAGTWNTYFGDGGTKSETVYDDQGVGTFTSFYASGKTKATGKQKYDNKIGLWEYYREDGSKEAECHYIDGKGTYVGYYPDGSVRTKGQMENDLSLGTWELYKPDGTLQGYYRPFYNQNVSLGSEINALLTESREASTVTVAEQKKKREPRRFFTPRYSEYKSLILASNPIQMVFGSLPFHIEFYSQERMGHDFLLEVIRDPFMVSDNNVTENRIYRRGFSFSVRQKFYFPLNFGMFYAAHELRSINQDYLVNYRNMMMPTELLTVSSSEQLLLYGLQVGMRMMRNTNRDGFTMDGFIGFSMGRRKFSVDDNYARYFESVNKSKLATEFRFGLSFGYSMSFGKNY